MKKGQKFILLFTSIALLLGQSMICFAKEGTSTMAEMKQQERAEMEIYEATMELREQIVKTALSAEGIVPYKVGGKATEETMESAKNGVDCSGFVDWVYRTAARIPTGRSTVQFVGEEIAYEDLQIGDVAMYRPKGSLDNHVAIYVGHDEKEDLPIWCHASYSAREVVVTTYDGGYKYFYTVLGTTDCPTTDATYSEISISEESEEAKSDAVYVFCDEAFSIFEVE